MKSILIGISNLIKWFKVIWNDRDYDMYYFEIMMLKKLNGMRVSMRTYNKVEYSDEKYLPYFKALNICIAILERRSQDFYHNLIWKGINGDIVFKYIIEEGRMVINKNFSSFEHDRYHIQKTSVESIRDRDLKIFGKLIGTYLENWWD